MEETLKAHLEKVWTEYIEYKEYIKDKVKTPEQLRDEVSAGIKTIEDAQKIKELLFEKGQKNAIYQADFHQLLSRLHYTVEAYKDVLEIPQEIKKEAENYKFNQTLQIKNGREKIINQEAVDTMKQAIEQSFEQLMKFYK